MLLTGLGITSFITVMYLRAKHERPDVEEEESFTFERVLDSVKVRMADLVKDENLSGLDDEEFKSMYKRKSRIQNALQNCVYGIDSAKLIVQDLIRSILADMLKTEEAILQVVNFHDDQLDTRLKFEILMYFY